MRLLFFVGLLGLLPAFAEAASTKTKQVLLSEADAERPRFIGDVSLLDDSTLELIEHNAGRILVKCPSKVAAAALKLFLESETSWTYVVPSLRTDQKPLTVDFDDIRVKLTGERESVSLKNLLTVREKAKQAKRNADALRFLPRFRLEPPSH